MNWPAHDYQKRAVKFMLQNAEAAMLLQPGLGKSSISLSSFKTLKAKGLVDGLLVIAPLRICHLVWPQELRKWKDFDEMSAVVLHGKDKDKLLKEKHDVYIVNYDGLKWLTGRLSKMETWPFSMVVMDESTRVKDMSTVRFKLLKSILPKFRRRYILTGTPASNNLIDIFGQYHCMDQGKTLGKYISKFKDEFFYPSGYGGYDWKLKDGSEEKIHARIAPVSLQMSTADYLTMPPLIIQDVLVELPDAAMRMYRQMDEQLILAFDQGLITAANAAVATNKLRQIAGGGIYHADGDAWELIHNEKTDALYDLIEELSGQPALVAYEYRHDMARIHGSAIGKTPYIGGGVSPKVSAEIEASWNKGEIPVLLGQTSSVARGLNLQGGSAIIWHSLTWSLEDYDQLIARVWRQGQKKPVYVYRIIAKNTVDEVIIKALDNKAKTQNALFDALKKYWQSKTTR